VQDKAVAFTLAELAQLLDLRSVGDSSKNITGLATLASASPGDLSFFHNEKFLADLKKSRAGAVIVAPAFADACPADVLISDNPYLSYAQASRLFEKVSQVSQGIHPTAVIHQGASIAQDVAIGAHCVIEDGVVVGRGCRIGANSIIGQGCEVGPDSLIHANVTLYHGVKLGARAIIHAGVVLGSDGFGFARDGDRQIKIAQLGGVEIGNDVEIGAGTTIDRGALDNTVIGDGVKIDNQVQIAHNVTVGENTVICGCSAIAGSSRIGKNCIIAGGVGIINHVTIADGVTVTAMSLVNKSINRTGVYSSGTGISETAQWKKNIVHFRQLDKLNSRVKKLEKPKSLK